MKKLIVSAAVGMLFGGFAISADINENDLIAIATNGALSEKDVKVLSAEEEKQVVGGWWTPTSMHIITHPLVNNFSYYNALYNQAQRENRPAISPLRIPIVGRF